MRPSALLALCAIPVLFLPGCPSGEQDASPPFPDDIQRQIGVTATVEGQETDTLSLASNPDDAIRTVRSDDSGGDPRIDGIQQCCFRLIVDAELFSGSRPWEVYTLLTHFSTNDHDDPVLNSAGNLAPLLAHRPRLAIASKAWHIGEMNEEYDYGDGDSELQFANPVPPLGTPVTGRSYLARIEFNDPFIPWRHPHVDAHVDDTQARIDSLALLLPALNPIDPDDAARIQQIAGQIRALRGGRFFLSDSETLADPTRMITDMRRLSEAIFENLKGMIQRTVDAIDGIALGGSDGDGDYHLHVMPQTKYRIEGSVSDPEGVVRRPGFGYRFEATINAYGLVDLRLRIPILILMDLANDEVDVLIEPLHLLATGEIVESDLDGIVVSAETPLDLFEQQAAEMARSEVIAGMLAFVDPGGDAFEEFQDRELVVRLGLIEAVRRYRRNNPYRESNTQTSITEFDVIALPAGGIAAGNPNGFKTPMAHQYHGIATTRVVPTGDGATPFRVYLLE